MDVIFGYSLFPVRIIACVKHRDVPIWQIRWHGTSDDHGEGGWRHLFAEWCARHRAACARHCLKLQSNLSTESATRQATRTEGQSMRQSQLITSSQAHLRNRRWGGCVYVLQMFFLFLFCFFSAFSIRQKIWDNRSRERLNGFSWNFYQTIAGKMEFASPYLNGARPPINFLGAKNYTLRTWRWRLASDWELVCWLWHCAATAVALKRHERVNAFNLVFAVFYARYQCHRYKFV